MSACQTLYQNNKVHQSTVGDMTGSSYDKYNRNVYKYNFEPANVNWYIQLPLRGNESLHTEKLRSIIVKLESFLYLIIQS